MENHDNNQMNNEDDNEIPVEGEKVDVDLNDVVNHIGSTLFDDGKNEQEENNQETPNDNNAPDQDDSKRSSSSSSDSSDFSEEKEKENIEAEKSENIEGKNQNDENDEGKLENTINQNVNSLLDGQNENTDQSPENANEIEKTDENQQNNNSAGINRDLQQNDVAPSSENIQNEQSKAPFETDVQENTAIPQPNPDNQEYYSTSYSSSYYEEEEINETMHIPQLDPISRQNPNQKNAMRKDDDDDGVPPGLKPLIYHAKDSLTYQALRNEQIHGLTQTALTSIVNDLRKYVDMAVDHNLINEACHVQMCIDTIRNDHSAEKMQVDRELTDIEKRLQEANLELEERLNFWRNQEYTINKEFEMQVQDLQINREQALSDLDNEWASPKKQQSYSKPSPALLNMRHMAKKMIRTQQFEEVKKLARLIEDKERQEIESAAKRMNDDYHIADQRLKEQFDHELQVIESMHEMKIHNITRSRDQSLRPLYQRIENLQKMKDQATKQQKKTTQLVMTTTPRKRANATSANTPRMSSRMNQRGAMQVSKKSAQTPQKQLPQLLVTPKLALPPVQRIKREAPKSQLSNQSQNPTQASASSAIVRPKTFSRLSNTPDKNSQKKMPNGSLMYH